MKKQTDNKKYTLVMFIKNFLKRASRKLKHSSEYQKKRRMQRKFLFKIEHYPTLLSQNIKERYHLLTKLKSIDEDVKSKINHGMVKDYAFRISILNLTEDRLHVLREWLYTIANICFVLSVGVAYLSFAELFFRFGGGNYYSSISNYALRITPVIAYLILYMAIFSFLASKITFTQQIFLEVFIITVGTYYFFNQWAGNRIFIFGVVGIEIIRSLSILIDTVIYIGFERHMRKYLQSEIIVYNILLVMHEIDNGFFSTLYFKNYLATRLEYAASYMENYIYLGLKTKDESVNVWTKEKTRQIASALRAKKKLIFLSKSDTSQKLMRSLSEFLIHFQNNEWSELERLEISEKSWRDNIKSQTPIIARNLLFGLLPLSILLLLPYLHIVAKPFSDSIIGIAILWAIVNLLWLDPSAKEKINAVKDATASFKG